MIEWTYANNQSVIITSSSQTVVGPVNSVQLKEKLTYFIETMAKLSGILILFAAILCAVLVIQTVEGNF